LIIHVTLPYKASTYACGVATTDALRLFQFRNGMAIRSQNVWGMIVMISSTGALERRLARTRHHVFLAALALITTVSGSASASPITYVFSPDASIVVGGGTETITGHFAFDSATSTESSVSITLTGPFIQPIPTTFSVTGPALTSSNRIFAQVVAEGTVFWEVTLDFADPLSTAPDPLSSAGLYFYNVGNYFTDLPVTGSAVPPGSPIPEPSGIILFGGALCVLSFACRLSQRARRP